MRYPKTFLWNNKAYKKFYIIRNVDIHSGFCAIMVYVLNGIKRAEAQNAIPVIHFDKYNTPDFYDSCCGESIWEYFFEAISPYSIDDIQRFKEEKILTTSDIYLPSSKEVIWGHHHDKQRLATFWAYSTPIDKENWMKEKRRLGRKYINKYIRLKPQITEKASSYINTHFKDSFIIGVHVRGTDFAYARPTNLANYFEEIDRIILENSNKVCRVYLATDQEQYLTLFKSRYFENLLYIDAIRSNNHIAPFRIDNDTSYKKGEDVLLDIIMLSKCNHVIKGAAAVGEMALWFNTGMGITDFSLQSEFYQNPYHKLETAYSSLNIGKKSSLTLAIHKLKFKGVRRITVSIIGYMLFKNFKFIRKLLRH